MPRPKSFDLDALRTLLRQAAFVGLPGAAIALAGCGCPPPTDQMILVRDPSPPMRALIEKCVDGARNDCNTLCSLLVEQEIGYQRGYFEHCEVHPQKDGYVQVHVGWDEGCPGGRRPAGFAPRQNATRNTYDIRRTTGNWLACLAQLESASVPAFARVQHELKLQDAPAVFIQGARQAIADETKHAQMVGALARRFGANTIEPVVPPAIERPLFQMVHENAIEGCIREMYGALLAHHQSATATDPNVANTMHTIAEEETQHATLAWSIHAWGMPRLTTTEQRHVCEDARLAVATLRRSLEDEFPLDMRSSLGLPSAQRAVEMLDGLADRLLG